MNFYEASFHWKLLEQRLNASLQMFNGIYFLQQKGVVLRDLKEINMLVDNQNTIKMIDFGSACEVYQEKPAPGSFMAITKERILFYIKSNPQKAIFSLIDNWKDNTL